MATTRMPMHKGVQGSQSSQGFIGTCFSATDIALKNGVSVLAVRGWIEWAEVSPFTVVDGVEMFTRSAAERIETQRLGFEAAGRLQGVLYPRAPRFWNLTGRPGTQQVRGVSIE